MTTALTKPGRSFKEIFRPWLGGGTPCRNVCCGDGPVGGDPAVEIAMGIAPDLKRHGQRGPSQRLDLHRGGDSLAEPKLFLVVNHLLDAGRTREVIRQLQIPEEFRLGS